MINTLCAICGTHGNSAVLYKEKLGNRVFDWYTFSARRSFDAESRIHYRTVKCKTCGLVRSDPILEPDKIFNLYKKSELIYEEEMEDIGDTYLGYLNRATRYVKNKDLILEIGCGNGFFLKRALEFGFKDVRGVEPGLPVLKKTPPELQGKLIADVFKEGLFLPDSFDMVCIFQTLDHLIEPNETVGEIFKILKPGGIVLALNHDVESLSAKIMGERSPIFDVQHTYLYSKKTQTALFKKNNFQIKEVFNVWNSYRLRYWLKLAPVGTSVKKIVSRILMFLHLWNLKIPLRAGNLAIIAQKPNG